MTQTSPCRIEYCPAPNMLQIHTSFDIRENAALKLIIEHIEGVEPIFLWGSNRYSFTVCVGSMFKREDVGLKIAQKIIDFAAE